MAKTAENAIGETLKTAKKPSLPNKKNAGYISAFLTQKKAFNKKGLPKISNPVSKKAQNYFSSISPASISAMSLSARSTAM